jgi:propionyl-CoA synthetase
MLQSTINSAIARTGRHHKVACRCLGHVTSTRNENEHQQQRRPFVDRSTIKGPHGNYEQEYAWSRVDPEGFWAKAAKNIEWFQEPKVILEQDANNVNHYRWFPDGIVNTCYNCLDVHVRQGRANQLALVYDSPVTKTQQSFTYAELLSQVATFAGVLRDLGVEQGDRVVIYMPMIPQAVIAMLACARIGAIHSVVFGGFAAKELATRITDANPKIDCH